MTDSTNNDNGDYEIEYGNHQTKSFTSTCSDTARDRQIGFTLVRSKKQLEESLSNVAHTYTYKNEDYEYRKKPKSKKTKKRREANKAARKQRKRNGRR